MPNATAAARKGALKANTVITMRVGTRAMLVMDDDRSHIQIAVVSLENGITGHKIRVASPDHKQVYIAEVVSGHLLRRSF
jgi:flagella basal body P-ring formation protein FlgA